MTSLSHTDVLNQILADAEPVQKQEIGGSHYRIFVVQADPRSWIITAVESLDEEGETVYQILTLRGGDT